jgi:trehalose/maltose transport system substrate-binding protein
MDIFNSGGAAFARRWILTPMSRKGEARQIGWRSLDPVTKSGLSRMPGETEIAAGTLGGTGTGISSHSTHRQDAIALLRFQLRSLIEEGEKDSGPGGPNQVEIFTPPSFSDPRTLKHPVSLMVARPSIETGIAYKTVSKAYSDAVHSVLTGQESAPDAAAKLEKQLIGITGFRPGPPETGDNSAR